MALLHASFFLLLAALALAVAAARSQQYAGKFDYLVFPEGCLPKFLAGDLFDEFCLKKTISKVLGYGIITGACVVKLPQIIAFVRAGSVKGVSPYSTYLELLGYLMASIYHIVLGNPWSAYGETVIVTVQAVLISVLLWVYDPPGVAHILGVSTFMAVAAQQTYAAPREYLPYVQIITIVLFVLSRAWQIVANFSQRSTGELAFLTLFMNAAGSAARIFTSSQEVKQREVLISFVISTLLNFILLSQYIFYNIVSKSVQKSKAAPVRKATTVEKEDAAGSEQAAEAGGSARRRRAKRDA